MFNESVKNKTPYQSKLPENNSTSETKEKEEQVTNDLEAEIELKKQTEKAIKKKNERIQVLNELITTEREYLYELKLCYDTFMIESLEDVRKAVRFR